MFATFCSLQEGLWHLLSSLRSVSDDVGDPLINGPSGLVELSWIGARRSVELRAMTATIAVAGHAHLVELWAWLTLSGPLPGILSAISEEDVGASSVKATLINSRLVSLWIVGHVKAIKHVSTVSLEVVDVNDWAAHRLIVVHSLEPSVLRAVLEAPWAARAVRVDHSARQNRTIVLVWSCARVSSVLDKGV